MIHLTITSGHVRESPRSEVTDHVVAMLRPLIALRSSPFPASFPGWTMEVDPVPGGALYRAMNGGVVAVECAVAWGDGATAVWVALLGRLSGTDAAMPATLPWCAAALVGLAPGDAWDWLGDWERCVAWALIEAHR